MKKVSSLFTMAIIAAVAFTSCEDEQTYAKQKEYETSERSFAAHNQSSIPLWGRNVGQGGF